MATERPSFKALEEEKRRLLEDHQSEKHLALKLLKQERSAGNDSSAFFTQTLEYLINSCEKIGNIPCDEIVLLRFTIRCLFEIIQAYNIQDFTLRKAQLIAIYNSLTYYPDFEQN